MPSTVSQILIINVNHFESLNSTSFSSKPRSRLSPFTQRAEAICNAEYSGAIRQTQESARLLCLTAVCVRSRINSVNSAPQGVFKWAH